MTHGQPDAGMARRPTIHDIAARAGVSTGAVSYALNGRPGVSEQTRARILDAAAEMGWQPSAAARALSGARAHAVGLVLARPASTLGVEPFFMRFISGLEAELSQRRTALMLQVAEDHDEALVTIRTWWAEQRVDGVILTDMGTDDPRIPALSSAGVPAVLVGRPRPGSGMPAVWSDDAAAVTQAVDHLVALGHRRVARVAGPAALEHTRIRDAAFHAAAGRHRLPRPLIVGTDYSWEQGAEATQSLLRRRDRPTALVFDSDIMALAGLSTARRLDIPVPDQLSIVAGDDSQLCEMTFPALSALTRDVRGYGAAAARTLLALLDKQPCQDLAEPAAQLTARDSTAAPPARVTTVPSRRRLPGADN